MRLGAHVSARDAVHFAVDRALALGCDCLQIFVANPRQWQARPLSRETAEECRRKLSASAMQPLVAHAPYLINLAAPDAAMRARSVDTLLVSLCSVVACGGRGVVTHIGSRLGATESAAIRRVAASVRRVLRGAPQGEVLLENSAGTTLGGTLDELARMLDALDGDARVGVCLDTAHLFAAGWDLRTAAGTSFLLDEVERVIGLSRVRLFHLNDSRAALGSRLDRHENIGAGGIGAEGFRALLGDPRLAAHAGVLEVPGYDQQGPDQRNMDTLRALAGGAPLKKAASTPSAPAPRPSRRRPLAGSRSRDRAAK
jgi:deoxyribonuclease-4